MASMWRRAMVYLGLQDDDELDYGDQAEEPQAARPRRESGADVPDGRTSRDSGTVRTRPSDTDYATDYFGPNAARLAQARATYDPHHFFTQPQDF